MNITNNLYDAEGKLVSLSRTNTIEAKKRIINILSQYPTGEGLMKRLDRVIHYELKDNVSISNLLILSMYTEEVEGDIIKHTVNKMTIVI